MKRVDAFWKQMDELVNETEKLSSNPDLELNLISMQYYHMKKSKIQNNGVDNNENNL